MVDEHRADKESPHQHLAGGGVQAWIQDLKEFSETKHAYRQNRGRQHVKSVEESKFRIYHEVLDQADVGLIVLAAEKPPHVRPQESANGRRVDIVCRIGGSVM